LRGQFGDGTCVWVVDWPGAPLGRRQKAYRFVPKSPIEIHDPPAAWQLA